MSQKQQDYVHRIFKITFKVKLNKNIIREVEYGKS